VLVTGATGVVGFAVAKTLGHVGAKLVLHARREAPPVAAQELEAATWRHGPLAEATGPGGKFDYVFHCATYGQPQKFSEEWRDTVTLNVDGLLRLLDATQRLGFASTTEIYSGLTVPAAESMSGITSTEHPRAIYIESKRLGEAICARSGIAVANRIALASGPYPRADDSRAIYQIIRRARSDGLVSLTGGATNIRQYQYSFACALRFIVSTLLGRQLIYNNAGPYLLSMEHLARAIAGGLRMEFRSIEDTQSLVGAPAVVSVSTARIADEFPFLAQIDPSFGFFVDAVIEATT
jgi:nucleoside-diphosphate-sugar epimerase